MNVWVTSLACLRDSRASRKSLDVFVFLLTIFLLIDSVLFAIRSVGGIDVSVST